MPELRPTDLSDAGLARVSAFLLRMFPEAHHLTPSYLAWDYEQNPDGAAISQDAFVFEQLVGHVAGQRLQATVHGHRRSGILVHNVASDPLHRRHGLFTRMMLAMLEDARAQGVDFAVAVSNASSTPAFLRKLDFQLVRPLDAKLGVGASPAPGPGARADFQRDWSPEALAWRVRAPGRRYRMRGRTLLASGAAPGVAAELATLEIPPEELVQRSAQPPAPLRLWIGIDPRRSWRGSRYLDVPRRLRPSPLNMVYRPLGEHQRPLDPECVRIDAIDFDAY